MDANLIPAIYHYQDGDIFYGHILQAAGADVNLCAQDGYSPLLMAQEQGDQAMIALLTGSDG